MSNRIVTSLESVADESVCVVSVGQEEDSALTQSSRKSDIPYSQVTLVSPHSHL